MRDELGVLKQLLRKNANQHRRGGYFKQLSMAHANAERALRLLRSRPGSSPPSRRRALAACVQVECAAAQVCRAAAMLTALIARTHFMALSLAFLAVLARLHALLGATAADAVRRYNALPSEDAVGGATDGASPPGLPDFVSLDLQSAAHPKLRCHPAPAVALSVLLRCAEDASSSEDEDLPVVIRDAPRAKALVGKALVVEAAAREQEQPIIDSRGDSRGVAAAPATTTHHSELQTSDPAHSKPGSSVERMRVGMGREEPPRRPPEMASLPPTNPFTSGCVAAGGRALAPGGGLPSKKKRAWPGTMLGGSGGAGALGGVKGGSAQSEMDAIFAKLSGRPAKGKKTGRRK